MALLFSLNVVIKWGEKRGGTDRASRDGETPKAERVSEASNSQSGEREMVCPSKTEGRSERKRMRDTQLGGKHTEERKKERERDQGYMI